MQILEQNKALSQQVKTQSEALSALSQQVSALSQLVQKQSEALSQLFRTQLSEVQEDLQHLKAQTVSAASVVPPDNLGLPLTDLSGLTHLESQLTGDSRVGDVIVSNLLTI